MPDKLGELELLVLLALRRLGPEAYGVAVQQELACTANRQASVGAIYTTLGRLEAKGLTHSRVGEPTAERGGRRKRYFELSQAGAAALHQTLSAVARMSHGTDPSMDTP